MQRKWGKTFKDLIKAPTEKEFDEILNEYIKNREENGYEKMQKAQTALMNENKSKLGIK